MMYRIAKFLDRPGLSHPCRAARSHRGVEGTGAFRSGESDDLASGMNLSQRLDRRWSVHVRQVIVDDHDFRPQLPGDLDALRSGQCRADDDDPGVLLEQAHDTLKEHLVVVDHDNPDRRLFTHRDRAPCVHSPAASPGQKASPPTGTPFREQLLLRGRVGRDRT